jgi:hypothetical protein
LAWYSWIFIASTTSEETSARLRSKARSGG